jgi:hypothetical protein
MPRTPRFTSTLARALAGRGKFAAAGVGVAAVLAGAGSASAATLTTAPHAPAAARPAALAGTRSGALASPASGVLALGHSTPVPPPAASQPAPAAAQPSAPAAPAAQPAAPAPAPAPAQPYQVYDSVTPSQIPAGQPVATYADGGYAVNPANVASRGHVTWIDTNGSDPKAAALDVEPGDATPSQAAAWTWNKLHGAAGQIAVIYTMRSEWPATQAAIATLPQAMQHQVRWWIADPTGVAHVVPGAQATQWYWGQNYDISTALPGSGL